MKDKESLEVEYNNIFGKKTYDTLYPSDDESYNSLRREIISTEPQSYDKDILPFIGVSLKQERTVDKKKSVDNSTCGFVKQIVQSVKNHIIEQISLDPKVSISIKGPIFHLKTDILHAFGSYDEKTRTFSILKNSTVALNEVGPYKDTESAQLRRAIIGENCTREASNYKVNKDIAFKTATVATNFVMGEYTSSQSWLDEDGHDLSFHFPEKFSAKKKEMPGVLKEHISNERKNYFYLKKNLSIDRSCDAHGIYNKNKRIFILKAGSVLALKPTEAFRYSALGIYREKLIKKFCSEEINGYRLNKDIQFETPTIAASLCLGRQGNGWQDWKNARGESLRDVYKNKI